MQFSDDFELVEKTVSGDIAAFDGLVLKYQDRIFNIAYRMLGSYEEAKDAVQEALVNVYRSLGNFRKESSFYTYLCQVVINLCKNKLRKLAQGSKTISMDAPINLEDDEVRMQIPDAADDPRQELDRKDKKARIQDAINSLDEEHKSVVVLRDIEEMSYEDIAQALDLNIGTVKSKLHRARQVLKEKLKDVI